ncbi:putative permease [Granulicella aggregans]|uniref:Putative permease n=1 Tax=Granulicella aggregans TaxID=474949 RepID=A0A7W7ZAC0_9BACT|nr:ABC transporter permease [Granulicella aggregans]MBB5056190.1 putative permease [Granulicella aggregans]
MSNLLQDVRFALRQMRRSPGFAITAVLTLALGIAANVIVFGVVDALILRPLDVDRVDRVRQVQPLGTGYPVFSYPEIRELRESNTVFSAVAAEVSQNFGMEADGLTRPVWGLEVSGQYFEVIAVKAAMGRLLTRSDDDHPGASNAAVITWATWKTEFNGDPNIVGEMIRLNKQPYTIVGVTAEGFHGTETFLQPGIVVPMANEESLEGVSWLDRWSGRNIFAMARLKDGVTDAQVKADLDAIANRVRHGHPVEEEKLGYRLTKPGLIGDYLGRPARAFLSAVLGLGGIVLLAACANLGSLFAARTADRTREIAIRMAVGSSRWRVVQQVLVEAVVISLFGGMLACGLAWIGLTELARWNPPSDYPIRFQVTPQPSLILVALAVSVVAGLVFGVMPLRQIFKTDPNEAIKSGGQGLAGRRWALRDVLLALQIALCCVTVTAVFVALRGMTRALTMDLGFNPKNVTLTRFDVSQAQYKDEAAEQFQRRLLERVAAMPGVKAAGYANTTPLANPSTTDVYAQQTTDMRPSNVAFASFIYQVSPGYFNAAETRMLAGRDVSFTDTAKTPRVAVVNREFVKSLLHSVDVNAAIGRYFKNRKGELVQIVGVVENGKYFFLSEDQSEALFYPITQAPDTATDLIVRADDGAEGDMAERVRALIREMDVAIPLRASESWKSSLAFSFFPAQVATAALSVFGAFGLLLSIAGTFGLASYTVSKRLRELSIRVALGAQGRQVLRAALGRMLILLAGGSLVGIGLGVATGKLLSAVVYQASANDPVVICAVGMTMVLTGLLSVTGPVRRALQIDPANVLREQ